jgi:hypothetical protein
MSQPIACGTFGYVVAVALLGVTPALAAPAAPTTPPLEALPPTSILEAVPPVPAPPPPPPAPAALAAPFKLLEADVGTRLGLRLQNPSHPEQLNDVSLDGQVQLLLSGQATRHILWQADFVGTFGTVVAGSRVDANGADNPAGRYDATGSAAVLDLIARFELHDAFNLWVGRMLVPADRSGLSTEWSIAPWLFPGQFVGGEAPVGARQGPHGRSDGVTLWGQLGGGTFKYYLGAFNLADPNQSPLFSGRLSLSLLNPEPGYRNASTYYGRKDVLGLGVGFQHQHNGWADTNPPTAWADLTELNFDLFFEKNLGPAGVLDLEGAFYKIWGRYAPASLSYFLLASYLLPIEIGVGRFQLLFRLQQASDRVTEDTDALADAQLGYVIDGLRARVALDYQYSKVWGQTGNAVLLGLQLQTK